jgi:hypothetical protein
LQASRRTPAKKLYEVIRVVSGPFVENGAEFWVCRVRGYFLCSGPDKKFRDLIAKDSKQYVKGRYPSEGAFHPEFKGAKKALRGQEKFIALTTDCVPEVSNTHMSNTSFVHHCSFLIRVLKRYTHAETLFAASRADS